MPEIAALPSVFIADDLSALPSPSSSSLLFLPVHVMPALVSQLLYCTTVLFKVKLKLLVVQSFSSSVFATPWTVALQGLLPMEFPSQEYWNG